eukprot:1196423-Prorocentrum_minimum.AAC.1
MHTSLSQRQQRKRFRPCESETKDKGGLEGERAEKDLGPPAPPAPSPHPAPHSALGLHTAIKPLLSHPTTGEFNSPPNRLRTLLRHGH